MNKVKELTQRQIERQTEQDTKLATIRQQLAEHIQRHEEIIRLGQKLEESKELHSSSLEELNRIHDDKLQCLEMELQSYKQEDHLRPDQLAGDKQQVEERYRLDLEEFKKNHQRDLEQLLAEHQDEVDAINAQLDKQLKEELHEHEVTACQH
jgi:hypothetical protein